MSMLILICARSTFDCASRHLLRVFTFRVVRHFGNREDGIPHDCAHYRHHPPPPMGTFAGIAAVAAAVSQYFNNPAAYGRAFLSFFVSNHDFNHLALILIFLLLSVVNQKIGLV